VVVADHPREFADEVCLLLGDVERRHRWESEIRGLRSALPTWESAVRALSASIEAFA